jgi:hypothetical protein
MGAMNAVTGVGDLDADGFEDFAVGEPGAGKVHVYSGVDRHRLRTITDPHDLSGTPCAPGPSSPSPCRFGWSVAAIGDIDADGIGDVAVGARGSDPGFHVACNEFGGEDCDKHEWPGGRAFAFSGATGAMLHSFSTLDARDGFGYAVAGIGDVTGDGTPDVAVGRPGLGFSSGGYVYAFSGSTGAFVWRAEEQAESQGHIGMFLSAIEDVNGDARPDLLAAAPHYEPGGAVYVLSGATGATVRVTTGPAPDPDDFFGGKIATVGDQDADGIDDYVVGERRAGRLYLYSGGDGSGIATLPAPADESDAVFALAAAGDQDGDGLDDVWVGAPTTGSAFLINRYGDLIAQIDDPTPDPAGLGFGAGIAPLGGLEGFRDLDAVVGDPLEEVGLTSAAGAAFVIRPDRYPVISARLQFVFADEGSRLRNDGTASDPDGDAVTLSATSGTVTREAFGDAWSWSEPAIDGPSGSYVAIHADDGRGLRQDVAFPVFVTNLPPDVFRARRSTTDPLPVDAVFTLHADFTDRGVVDTHSSVIDWGDGSTSDASIEEHAGAGTASGDHTYAEPGSYDVRVTVTDDDLDSGQIDAGEVVVFDPLTGAADGLGTIDSPVGADAENPHASGPAVLTLSARYVGEQMRPTGSLSFDFAPGFITLRSLSLEWLNVQPGAIATVRGRGLINAAVTCSFEAHVSDRDSADGSTFGIRIYGCDAGIADRYQVGTEPLTAGEIVVQPGA